MGRIERAFVLAAEAILLAIVVYRVADGDDGIWGTVGTLLVIGFWASLPVVTYLAMRTVMRPRSRTLAVVVVASYAVSWVVAFAPDPASPVGVLILPPLGVILVALAVSGAAHRVPEPHL